MNEHKLQNKISQNPIYFLLPLRRNLFNFDIGGYFESEILNTNLFTWYYMLVLRKIQLCVN